MKLLQSEQQLAQLKRTIGQHNGPGLEAIDASSQGSEFPRESTSAQHCAS